MTLTDGHEYRKDKLEFGELVTSLVIVFRANEESATKSMRLKKAWEQKRANAKEKTLTSRLPGWLELRDGKMVVRKEVAGAIREIFQFTSKGLGIIEVQKRINAKYTKLIRAEYISRTCVQKLLTERAVLGEYQRETKCLVQSCHSGFNGAGLHQPGMRPDHHGI